MAGTHFILAINSIPHLANWHFGWISIGLAFVTGAILGIWFHRTPQWEGYDSFRWRIVRLGHVAQAALGMMNVIYGLSPLPQPGTVMARGAAICFIIGGIAMPVVCFLGAWRRSFRHLFFIPVIALLLAVVFTLCGGA